MRRSQFSFRISKLSNVVRETQEVLLQLATRRAQLKQMLIATDKRASRLRATAWFIRAKRADAYYDSDALTGTPERYLVSALRTTLGMELLEVRDATVAAKKEVRAIDDRSAAL